jgi:hypothetical protein
MALTNNVDWQQIATFADVFERRGLTTTRVANSLKVSPRAVRHWLNANNNISRRHVNRFNFAYRAKVPYSVTGK